MTDNGSYTITNIDTAYGSSSLHENRCVGKALYAMNFETLNNDWSVISGLNTINNRPFEVSIKSGTGTVFPRASTMFVFCQFDMLIQMKRTGIMVLGRG